MARRWITRLLMAGALLALASCGRIVDEGAAFVGTLSRGQISFGSVSFSLQAATAYTLLSPRIDATARGLGSDTYHAELAADWALVMACVNNGTQVPEGSVNFPIVAALGVADLMANDRNGRADFTIDSSPGDETAAELAFERLGLASQAATICPNANYSLTLLGARYNSISINLLNPDFSLADSLTFVCADPANPAETCTASVGKSH